MLSAMDPRHLLRWYLEAGVDEAIAETPQNRFLVPAVSATPVAMAPARPSVALPPPPFQAVARARALADAANSLPALRAAVEEFDGCVLKKTATHTVFADGDPNARVMIVGEAPGESEDRQGIPFCGVSGQLLDTMFATIGLPRAKVYITNTLFWRPPGNRNPSAEELAMCEPFVEKHIALVRPSLLVCAGGVAATHLLKTTLGISKLRGTLHSYSNPYLAAPVPAVVVFHPSYLLRSPGQKKRAWEDLLQISQWLDSIPEIASPRA